MELEQNNARVAFSGPGRIRDGLVSWTAIPADAVDPLPRSGSTEAEFVQVEEVCGYFPVDDADGWWVEWGYAARAVTAGK